LEEVETDEEEMSISLSVSIFEKNYVIGGQHKE